MRNWGRAVVAIGIVAVGVFGTVGCAPEPAPTATPTGFANEAEAFAAAEATYRAYVDALNQVDLSDPSTFEAVYAWTTGDANANERQTLSEMSANGWVKSGSNEIVSFTPIEVDPDFVSVSARTCVDVTTIELLDASGDSVVPPERPDRYALALSLQRSNSATFGLRIATSNATSDPTCSD